MRLIVTAVLLLVTLHSSIQAPKKHRRNKTAEQQARAAEAGGYSTPLQDAASYSSNQYAPPGPPLRSINLNTGSPPPPQVPPVLTSLDILRNRPPLQAKEAIDVINYATAGKDYPVFNEIPKTYFSCANYKPGFYADPDTYCQVYHRCDISGKLTSYLCPPKTLFNQITLVCDWFYNIDCSSSKQFSDYSNSRLYYPQWQLLDTQLDYQAAYVQPPSSGPQYVGVKQQQNMFYNDIGAVAGVGAGGVNTQPATLQQHGPETSEYQMSLVIRNPQMVPDYTVGESQLVPLPAREQLDQGSTGSPSRTEENAQAAAAAAAAAENAASVVIDQPPRRNNHHPFGQPTNAQPLNASVAQDAQQQGAKRSLMVPNHLAYAS